MSTKQLDDIHVIASAFLQRHLRQEVLPVASEVLDVNELQVVLRRSTDPVYFVGFKNDGTRVWAHEEKFAKQIPENRVLEVMHRIGMDEVFPVWGTQAK